MSDVFLVKLASVFVLAIAMQWIAWRLRLPSILLLLLAGLAAGAGTAWLARHNLFFEQRFLNPEVLFGNLLLPAVSLSVALILFEGGMTLNVRELRKVGGVIWRLVTVGALITWVLAAAAAHYIVGLDLPLSVLLGAVLVVTGPTVIGPLLRHVRPVGAVGPVLKWEGIVIDPIGAMLAVVVFEVIATGPMTPAAIGIIALRTVMTGTGIGVGSAGVLLFLLRRRLVPDNLQAAATLAAVIIAFALANELQHEAGLFAVTVLGIILSNQRIVSIRHILEFKENLTLLLISVLFVVLGARLTTAQVAAALNWRAALFVLAMIFLVRPIAVALCTARSGLTWRERAFLASMAPRGIVAASVASVFALRLDNTGYPGADYLVPVTFALIFGTVTFYGLSARWVARRLGLSRPNKLGFLIAGADELARPIAELLVKEGFEVLLADTSREHVRLARLAGLPAVDGSILGHEVAERVELTSIGRLLALTPNDEVNRLAVDQFARVFGRGECYRLPAAQRSKKAQQTEPSDGEHGRVLFAPDATHAALVERLARGAGIKRTGLTREFNFEQFRQLYGADAVPLFVLSKESGAIRPFTVVDPPSPRPGQILIALAQATPAPPASPATAEKTSSPAESPSPAAATARSPAQ